jgi:hypothetical protein
MTVASCTEFLHDLDESSQLKQQMKAVTGTQEVIALGLRNGYSFDARELAEASSAFRGASKAPEEEEVEPGSGTNFYHYEFEMSEIPGFEPVLAELPNLKIQPKSVELAEFDRNFRADDLRSTDMSPAEPQFQTWYAEMMRAHWRDPGMDGVAPRRDFHLINLDHHVEHPDYERYFAAKLRTITALEQFFGSELRFSGSLWYPPSSYRLWHTNETQPGWRMYVIDTDGPFADDEQASFFRYLNPQTSQIVTLRERPKIVRFFRAEQDPARRFWHCIVNPSTRHRFSYGFAVPETWKNAFADRIGG